MYKILNQPYGEVNPKEISFVLNLNSLFDFPK